MAGPISNDPSSGVLRWDNSPGAAWLDVSTPLSSADVDFTDPDGPTGGKVPRQLYIEGGGVVTFDGLDRTVVSEVAAAPTVPDHFYLNGFVSYLYKTGTTATGIWAIL